MKTAINKLKFKVSFLNELGDEIDLPSDVTGANTSVKSSRTSKIEELKEEDSLEVLRGALKMVRKVKHIAGQHVNSYVQDWLENRGGLLAAVEEIKFFFEAELINLELENKEEILENAKVIKKEFTVKRTLKDEEDVIYRKMTDLEMATLATMNTLTLITSLEEAILNEYLALKKLNKS